MTIRFGRATASAQRASNPRHKRCLHHFLSSFVVAKRKRKQEKHARRKGEENRNVKALSVGVLIAITGKRIFVAFRFAAAFDTVKLGKGYVYFRFMFFVQHYFFFVSSALTKIKSAERMKGSQGKKSLTLS